MKFFFEKHTYLFLIVLITNIFTFCSGNKEKSEISKEQFKNILIDIYLVEAYISQNKYSNKDSTVDVDFYYQEVYKKHNIDKSILNSTYSFYAKTPAELEEVYNNVLDSLNRLQLKLKPVSKNDSTKVTSPNKILNNNPKNLLQK
jgi:3'-phosphoadenosine 5'-phosphosulfate sulfotransferase (PAPS reductase)/FAD synthetase